MPVGFRPEDRNNTATGESMASQLPQRGGRGGRGGRGNRGGQRGGQRDGGQGRGEGQDTFEHTRTHPEYFAQKNRERRANDTETKQIMHGKGAGQATFAHRNEFHQEENKGSRKGNAQRGGRQTYSNLGGAGQYLEMEGDERRIKGQDKVQFRKRPENKQQKDQVTVKYAYKDFLRQFENLSEQCVFLVESLAQGKQECIICSHQIYQRSALWNCRQCCQPFHLGCIKRWILKLNKTLE